MPGWRLLRGSGGGRYRLSQGYRFDGGADERPKVCPVEKSREWVPVAKKITKYNKIPIE
jgi:hypothetical protein